MITVPVMLSFLSFVALGLPDGLLGVAWPSLRGDFDQPVGALAWLLASGSAGYLLSSTNVGRIVRTAGLSTALLGGTLTIGVGLAVAAATPWWAVVMAGFALIGIGGGLVDAGFNAYAAHNFSATTMNWMHACYGIGATAGPSIVTVSLLHSGSWRPAYAFAAVFLTAVTVFLFRARKRLSVSDPSGPSGLPVADGETVPMPVTPTPVTEYASRESTLLTWGGVIVFFLYTGMEVSAGQLGYSLMTEGRGVDSVTAGFWVSAFWLCLTGGRILLGPISHRVGSPIVLRWAFTLSAGSALVFALGLHPLADGIALSVFGFALAPIFPLMVLLTPGRVGTKRANDVIGFQMGAATLGAVLLGGGGGMLADALGLWIVGPFIFIIALLCGSLYALLTNAQNVDSRFS